MAGTVVQRALQCPQCAGQCAFDPESGKLACQSCGAKHKIEVDPDVDPAKEFHYHPDLPHSEQMVTSQIVTHQCQTCGGEVVFTGPALSQRCAYCDGPVVVSAREASYQTLGLIPFAIPQDDAQKRALSWVKGRLAAPDDLAGLVAKGRVAGIYAPFWTFDSHEAVAYMVRHRVKRGKNWVTQTYRATMNTTFDDMLMPASPHVTPLIRDGILHDFRPTSLRPYQPAFLAGFAAERHHQSVTEGLQANAPDKDLLLRNRIKKHSGKSRIVDIGYKTHTTGIKYRRILLPVWILHYTYNDTAMKVVVCGLHGRTFGERPFCRRKLAGYAAAASAVTILFGWLWGASGVL